MNLKKRLLLLNLLFVSHLIPARDTVTVYFDKDGKRTTDKNLVYFYRKAIQDDKDMWKAVDYFTNNVVRMTGTYKTKELKLRHGHFIYYFENGKKKSEGECVDNLNEGMWTYWHESGAKQSEGKMLRDKKTGQWVYWYENGAKEREGSFEDGKPEGLWLSWYESGQKNTEGTYYNYLRLGVWKYYTEQGTLDFEENYESGKLFSIVSYHQNGAKKAKGYYTDNKRNGEFTFWNIDERMYLSGNYVNGKEHGDWIRYFANGETMRISYEDGVLKSKKLGGMVTKE